MKKNRKGFTLAELLIVVAIIGVLVAIFIPIFSSQLEKAREATDAANIRSQYAQVMADAITEGSDVDGKAVYGAIALKQKKAEWQDTNLKDNLEGIFGEVDGSPASGGTAWVTYDSAKGYLILHFDGSGNSGSAQNGNAEKFVTYRTEQSANTMQEWLTDINNPNKGYRNWKNGESIVIDGTVYISLNGENSITGKDSDTVTSQIKNLVKRGNAVAVNKNDTVLNYDDIKDKSTMIRKGTVIYGGLGWHDAPQYYVVKSDTDASAKLNDTSVFQQVF
jgi:prepilin-type N-terminal cleavage/methylation domain-containing protein